MTTTQSAVKPAILALADATHYLVGSIDENSDFGVLPGRQKLIPFRNIAAAKGFLRELEYTEVSICYQSAYDEMCGLESGKLHIVRDIV